MRSMASTSQRCSRRVAGSSFSSWAFSEAFMAKDGTTAMPKERKPARADAGNTTDMHFIGFSGTPQPLIFSIAIIRIFYSDVWIITGKLSLANRRLLPRPAADQPFHIGSVAPAFLRGVEDLVSLVDRLAEIPLLGQADTADAACD